MKPEHRIVVTGSGAVTAFGAGTEIFTRALNRGGCSIGPIRGFDPTGLPVRIASECEMPDMSAAFPLSGKAGKLAHAAAGEALAAAKIDPKQIEVGWSAAIGWTPPPVESLQALAGLDSDGIRKWLSGYPESAPGYAESVLKESLRLQGPGISDHAACAAGIHAFVHAARRIREGGCPVFLAGAADARCHPLGILGYARLGALTRQNADHPSRASRPFDADRSGFVIGEGAGFLILESLDHARKREARPLAELAGWALTNDADRMTDPRADGSGALACVQTALKRAGMAPGEIDYLNAHGTSTPQNDRMECLAYSRVFDTSGNLPIIGSTKSMIGHLSMASSAVESIACLEAIRDSFIPPNLNLENLLAEGEGMHFAPDHALGEDLRVVLKTAFGLGGQNAAIVWKRYED